MYTIGICDDDKLFCAELEMTLIEISEELNLKLEILVYYTGEELCDYLKTDNPLDIILLDIELKENTGIDVGHFIRDVMENQQIQIVYVSLKSNYALQLFNTQPFDFLLKPLDKRVLKEVLTKIVNMLKMQHRIFEFQINNFVHRVPYDDILYFKSNGRKVQIVLRHEELEYYDQLKNIVENVPSKFITIHKSYLVNLDYVIKYNYELLDMVNEDKLAISRVYQKKVRQKIMHFKKGAVDG